MLWASVSAAWYVTPPRSNRDWQELAQLVTDTFDAPRSIMKSEKALSIADQIKWNLVERPLTKQFNYRQYVETARRMKGKKYSILIAKTDSSDAATAQVSADLVVGVVEIGIKYDATVEEKVVDDDDDDDDNSTGQNGTSLQGTIAARRPTIGSLCVHPDYQTQGVGRALVNTCEKLIQSQWEEDTIYAEVQLLNANALAFFDACGYQSIQKNPTQDDAVVMMVPLQRQRKLEVLPHYLLSKRLDEHQTIESQEDTDNDRTKTLGYKNKENRWIW